MMEKILLGLLFLLDWVVVSACLPPQFYFVNKLLNWTEAQTYCRQKYTDLATILNSEQKNQLIDTLTSAGHSSDIWIGLFSEIHWKWSDGYTGSGADYRDWHINEPSWHNLNNLCVGSHNNGQWFDAPCTVNRQFLCYKGSHLDPEFVYVSTTMSWSNAQSYCRNNFVDLATIKNDTELQRVQSLIPNTQYPWIGLYRDPNVYWSNGSSVLFTNWDTYGIFIGSRKVMCGATSTGRSGKWKVLHCETRLPFVCYGSPDKLIQQIKVTKEGKEHKVNEESNTSSVLLAVSKKETVALRPKEQKVSGVQECGQNLQISILFRDFSNANIRLDFRTITNFRIYILVNLKKQIVKLRLHTEDFVELNDPVLRENILKKLQNRLQENGVSGVTLKWREQPDGRIFKKGKKEL